MEIYGKSYYKLADPVYLSPGCQAVMLAIVHWVSRLPIEDSTCRGITSIN